jgi:hypothetical protein
MNDEVKPDYVSAGPGKFDLSRLSLVDKVVAVASLIALVSIWLPWFTASVSGYGGSSESAATAHGGWMYAEFLVALALIAYLAARAAWDFDLAAHGTALVVGTAVQLVIMLIAFLDIPSVPSDLGISGVSVSWAWGAFIGLAMALVAAVPVLYPAARSFAENHNSKGATS